jgi:hypothetical protein
MRARSGKKFARLHEPSQDHGYAFAPIGLLVREDIET